MYTRVTTCRKADDCYSYTVLKSKIIVFILWDCLGLFFFHLIEMEKIILILECILIKIKNISVEVFRYFSLQKPIQNSLKLPT